MKIIQTPPVNGHFVHSPLSLSRVPPLLQAMEQVVANLNELYGNPDNRAKAQANSRLQEFQKEVGWMPNSGDSAQEAEFLTPTVAVPFLPSTPTRKQLGLQLDKY